MIPPVGPPTDDLPEDVNSDILRLVDFTAPAVNDEHCKRLPAALRAHDHGRHGPEDRRERLIGHRCWLRRHDFVTTTSTPTPGLTIGTPMAPR